jgi:hypothetical protein
MSVIVALCHSFASPYWKERGDLKFQKWQIELLCVISGNVAVVVTLVVVVTIMLCDGVSTSVDSCRLCTS